MYLEEKFESLQSIYTQLINDIDFDKPSFSIAIYFIIFNPTFWNIVARLEYHTHFLSNFTGSARSGCYTLAGTIFLLGLCRDVYFKKALADQPTSPILDDDMITVTGRFCVIIGQVLVATSMWKLGITGTYLGDYFGILMDEIVTDFPFNVSSNPMYQGSTLTFIGYTLLEGKAAGLLLSFMVYSMYYFALKFEEPFTAMIYAKRDEERANRKKKAT
ncbi:phosphatidyl-N-methylethanolamine N-methyltransferase [Zygosaccharomyces mellis]|uniref:Phosphatidyl-N-methylethanolamine N-methyltransferase n=1 Tax=Zygosaccharomyces mellis TaxID=42258 RepID=A0A4C2E5F1_9SACH|nr:phosphatidyl-N-methylethanolamine N-methyltransferase [Zygosaccharomyces mellis]